MDEDFEPDTLQVPPRPELPSFDFDDAFSDGEDPSVDYHFSPSIIREDIKNLQPSWGEEEEEEIDLEPPPNLNGFSVDQLDSSQSDDGQSSQPPDSPSPLQTPDESSSDFVQISLSVSGPLSDLNGQDTEGDVQEELNVPTEEPRLDYYPQVLIDASKSPAHRVTVSTDGSSWRNPDIPHLTIPPSHSSSESPPLSAHSTRSLPSTPKPQVAEQPNTSNSATTSSPVISPATSLPSAPTGLTSPPLLEITSKPTEWRPARSTGPSALEKYRSKTRPSFLPPKARKEDDKHMADWQTMMKHSRTAAEKRRKALHERRMAREKKIEESQHIWEKEIVPDWKVVHKNANLRKLWWKGIPTKLRASLWERAVGNPLALSKDNFRSCLARAKRALKAGTFPAPTLELLEDDVSTTLPALHIFHKETGPLYSDLKDMLYAWVVSRADEGLGYTTGAAKIAAMLLISIPPQQAFVVMRNLLERHCLRSFFGGDGARQDVEAYYRIFDTLLADGMPKIYFNFKQHQISPSAYLPDWLMSMFLEHLPFEACARIWDVILLEGDSFLFRAALGILAVLEPRLFFPERKELIELLRGENKAAIDVARREGHNLDGGKYEIYGVDEETLWERIDSMDDWWKESTWNRLTQRELPDR